MKSTSIDKLSFESNLFDINLYLSADYSVSGNLKFNRTECNLIIPINGYHDCQAVNKTNLYFDLKLSEDFLHSHEVIFSGQIVHSNNKESRMELSYLTICKSKPLKAQTKSGKIQLYSNKRINVEEIFNFN